MLKKLPPYYLWFENKQYLFTEPLAIIRTSNYKKIDQYIQQGYWVAGYFSYELGKAHLGVFDAPVKLTSLPLTPSDDRYRITQLRFNYSETEYYQIIKKIKIYIRQGETYQLNFTGKFNFQFQGNPLALYQALKQQQPVPYAAFCKLDNEYIISLSPELFFEQHGHTIITRPMKGTSPRGYNLQMDRIQVRQLRTSKKQMAENIMIVDLLRNDLNKICRPGSVQVPHLFIAEKYRTLLQLTSTITGQLKPNTTFGDIMTALFPGGSITGAPKLRTMQIISELETEPRGVYCGALGFVGPNEAQFNLPIRTLYLQGKQGELGVGSGITYDSDPKQEYQECLLKARFLTHPSKPFQLIETILWDKTYILLSEHLKRLKQSAQYFDYPINLPNLKKQLQKLTKKFVFGKQYKIRILLNHRDVACNVSTVTTDQKKSSCDKIIFSSHHTDSKNIFLYHKTTNRTLYDKEYKKYTKQGYIDVLFCNERDEITESAISNIIIKKNEHYYTPPVRCGLLPGIYRQHFITTQPVTEKILTVSDIQSADQIYICNAVRGLIPVTVDKIIA